MAEALVEYDYKALEEDELTIKKGDIITNIDFKPGGWWEGTLSGTGKRGMFPDNFVKLLGESNHKEAKGGGTLKGTGRKCKVLFSYKPAKGDELDLQVGDIINILGEEEEGWWRGELNNVIGVFPSNFVSEIMENPEVRDAAVRKPRISQDETSKKSGGTLTSNDQQDSKKAIPTLSKRESITRTFELLLHGTAEEQKVEMSLHHQGKELANTTIDSKNIIKLMPAEDKPDSNVNGSTISSENSSILRSPVSSNNVSSNENNDAPSLPPKPSKEMCRVLFPYEAAHEDELTLQPEDIITLITKDGQDVGWWKGELKGKIGVFPDNFVEVIPVEELLKPDRPVKVKKTNKLIDSISKSVSSSTISSLTSKKYSETQKIVKDEKGSPPSISKKPPPPLKKPMRSPSADFSNSLSSLLSKQFQENSINNKQMKSTLKISNFSEATKNSSVVKSSDSTDGITYSRQTIVTGGSSSSHSSQSASSISVTTSSIKSELDLDVVERAAMLTHPTASRAKAPRRRPPSTALKEDKKDEDMTGLVNGNADMHIEKPASNKLPFVTELRLNQATKTVHVSEVMIGPAETVDLPSEPTVSVKPGFRAGVSLKSPSQQPVYTSSKPPPPPSNPPPDETLTVTVKQWNELSEKVAQLESKYESTIDQLKKSIMDFSVKLEEEKQRRIHMQQEIEKLTNLVTQV